MELSELCDDPNIPNEEFLLRGIHQNHLDGTRISSSAFKSKTNPHVSVDRASLSTPEATHRRRPGDIGIAKLLTGKVREVTPGVASAPEPDNPAHALIIHDFSLSPAKWKEVAQLLAKTSEWIIPPPCQNKT